MVINKTNPKEDAILLASQLILKSIIKLREVIIEIHSTRNVDGDRNENKNNKKPKDSHPTNLNNDDDNTSNRDDDDDDDDKDDDIKHLILVYEFFINVYITTLGLINESCDVDLAPAITPAMINTENVFDVSLVFLLSKQGLINYPLLDEPLAHMINNGQDYKAFEFGILILHIYVNQKDGETLCRLNKIISSIENRLLERKKQLNQPKENDWSSTLINKNNNYIKQIQQNNNDNNNNNNNNTQEDEDKEKKIKDNNMDQQQNFIEEHEKLFSEFILIFDDCITLIQKPESNNRKDEFLLLLNRLKDIVTIHGYKFFLVITEVCINNFFKRSFNQEENSKNNINRKNNNINSKMDQKNKNDKKVDVDHDEDDYEEEAEIEADFGVIDTYCQMISMLLKVFPSSEQGLDEIEILTYVLTSVFRFIDLEMKDKPESFNYQPYKRILSQLLFELSSGEFLEDLFFDILTIYYQCYSALKPQIYPLFAFAWLELISDKNFIPKLILNNHNDNNDDDDGNDNNNDDDKKMNKGDSNNEVKKCLKN
ncbi:ccr4-not transcription complex subunit [Anaeramoeba flamelloides]|uniref:Ccr4-not transcription complex subunit n=1 Tax=Anaeramoeba flamelloides TaxID=1746091 RepID=A0AAV8ADX3_9EUKA|nr:ccr4-not transcription complex subunit [Anaeramoeba flamelloides]